ncbi:MAG: hypothetical protein QOE90_1592 [Thermoplasmata archaeon]|jgi:hypothetical protein|nr:hypothetical protein [Thermoplasmata archaeon]
MMLKTNEEIAQANAEAAAGTSAPTPIPVIVTPVHVPAATDVTTLVEAAHEHIEKLVNAELANIGATLAAAWRTAEANLAKAQADIVALQQVNRTLEARLAAAERKAAVLEEVRASLQKL